MKRLLSVALCAFFAIHAAEARADFGPGAKPAGAKLLIYIPDDYYGDDLYVPAYRATYKVEFRGNGSTSGTTYRQTMTRGKAKRLTACRYRKKGYQFIGWAKTRTGPVVFRDKQKVKNLARAGKTIKLYARWRKKAGTASGTWKGTSASSQVKTKMYLSESGGALWGYLVWPGNDTRDIEGWRSGSTVYLEIEGGDEWVLKKSGNSMSGTGYKYGTSRTYKLKFKR